MTNLENRRHSHIQLLKCHKSTCGPIPAANSTGCPGPLPALPNHLPSWSRQPTGWGFWKTPLVKGEIWLAERRGRWQGNELFAEGSRGLRAQETRMEIPKPPHVHHRGPWALLLATGCLQERNGSWQSSESRWVSRLLFNQGPKSFTEGQGALFQTSNGGACLG